MSPPCLYMETRGSGPDLCLLHGWGTHGGIWADWVASLAASHRVHVIDLPGHGGSGAQAGSEGFVLQEAAARVRATLVAAGVERVAVCGWSLGGLVGLQLALDAPALVTRLVLLASTPRFVNGEDWAWGVAPGVLDDFAADLEEDTEATLQRFLALQAQGSPRARETIRALRAALAARPAEHAGAQPAALRGALRVLRETDLRGRLEALETPALWVGGRRDVLVRPAALDWAAGRCRRGQAYIVPAAGHAPFISHAGELLAPVRGFLGHG